MAHSTDKQSRERLSTDKNVHVDYHFDISGDTDLLTALGTTLEPELLVNALTHRSFAHENPGLPNNERLEFLGDAVLEFVVTETLYSRFPSWPEGHLAKVRAKAVSEGALAKVGREKLHLCSYILLGHGEIMNDGANRDSILCDTVEALIGAVFLSHGIDGARATIHRLIDDTLRETSQEGPSLDWKTALIVLSHKLSISEPTYRMEVDSNLTHPTFTAHVLFDDSEVSCASGPSKSKAQLAAAQKAYEKLSQQKTEAKTTSSKTADAD